MMAPISFEMQRWAWDCGPATVANHTRVSWADAMRAMGWPSEPSKFSDIQAAVLKIQDIFLVPGRVTKWDCVPNGAITSVRLADCKQYHWVMKAWNGPLILDPGLGLKNPDRYLFRPCHFLVPRGHPSLVGD